MTTDTLTRTESVWDKSPLPYTFVANDVRSCTFNSESLEIPIEKFIDRCCDSLDTLEAFSTFVFRFVQLERLILRTINARYKRTCA